MRTLSQFTPPKLTPAEIADRSWIIDCANKARNQKEQAYDEFDGMSYEEWYMRSKRAAQGYIEPRRNQEDVRIVTGTTREKCNILVNTLLNYSLEADITAYDDKNIPVEELGELTEKMVRKSREIELVRYEVKRPLIYTELVNQGNVFVEESYDEYLINNDEVSMEGMVDPAKTKIIKKPAVKYECCNSNLLTGLQVFPGNVREFLVELQPYIIVRKVLTRAEAEAKYGSFKRWENVPKTYTPTEILENSQADGYRYDDYRMIQTEVDFVEELRFYCKWKNRYQVILNGVPMLSHEFPLNALLGVCEYPIAKGDCEPISAKFFWSRGVASKTKVDQFMADEMYKMMIVKTRKSYKPPLANMGNYNIGASVYLPGTIIKGIDPEKLKPIGDNLGVSVAEFNMMQFVKQMIDEKTVSPVFEGQSSSKGTTAREIVEVQKRSMVKMGMPMLGVINLENRMAWLRVNNIYKNWTKPIDGAIEKAAEGLNEQYRVISMEDSFEDGSQGERIIEFSENLPEPAQVYAEEKLLSEIKRKPVRKNYLNPAVLRSLKYMWKVEITPTEKTTSDLKAVMFEEFLTKILTIFAPAGKMPNMDYLAERYARVNQEDPQQVWAQNAPQGMPANVAQAMMGAEASQGGELQAQMTPSSQPKPSINTLVQG